ncbi:MAG: electron transfer flavoprotein subunit beta/FixA family protein [Candidatus Thorarchaeota archaeon]|nr:MAG: electron transfer flavoprotein subunit beta [Candidatus Thorarchaeota archaeon]RLI55779.1 MAG: electron transfer flavoprotein subunit beta [Candidatus Thorarchaeota archaeon]
MVNIIVPVKQVPEVTEVRINEETGTLIREGVQSILNPFDEFAVEAAVQIKEKLVEKHGDAYDGKVTIMTMGPPMAREALLKALAMGGDEAVHLTDSAFAGADTWTTAFTLSEQIKKMDFDMIICGKQAIDGDTAQVGPELAELLGIPQICYVRHLELSDDEKHVIAHRETDEGYEVIKAKLPLLITATKGINEPRLPNIMGIMKAKSKPFTEVNAETLGTDPSLLGLNGSPTQVRRIFPPERKKGGVKIEAEDPKEVAKKLVEFLAQKGAI